MAFFNSWENSAPYQPQNDRESLASEQMLRLTIRERRFGAAFGSELFPVRLLPERPILSTFSCFLPVPSNPVVHNNHPVHIAPIPPIVRSFQELQDLQPTQTMPRKVLRPGPAVLAA